MMKENVLDVLMYLFENYLDDDDNETEADRETLTVELEEAGFAKLEINKAFDWLENLARNPPDSEPPITQRDALQGVRRTGTGEADRGMPRFHAVPGEHRHPGSRRSARWSSTASWRWTTPRSTWNR